MKSPLSLADIFMQSGQGKKHMKYSYSVMNVSVEDYLMHHFFFAKAFGGNAQQCLIKSQELGRTTSLLIFLD